VHGYRKDHWQLQQYRVEVWSEKGTVRGTVQPVLNRLGVTFRVMHGYASATAVHDLAEETGEGQRPLVALYVGDWDPMFAVDLPARFDRYGAVVTFRRVAPARQDVEAGNLPSLDVQTKRGDTRAA
jgi:hypothetical protein